MKTSSLILIALLATSSLYAADIKSYELALTNDKVNYIDVPSLNLQLKTQEESSYEFIINYATSFFSKIKEQDRVQKQHSLNLSLNYEF